MARLDVHADRPTLVRVRLSRRNLLTLQHKLDMPGSQRRILSPDCFLDDVPADCLLLVLEAEDDLEHYGRRESPPGAMHPASETFVRTHGGWSPLQG
jgi:hypothetical protein